MLKTVVLLNEVEPRDAALITESLEEQHLWWDPKALAVAALSADELEYVERIMAALHLSYAVIDADGGR